MRQRLADDWQTTSGRLRGSTAELQQIARDLRQRQTAPEHLLWQHLRGQRLAGLRFRRQHPVGPYILDFACPEHLLGIEIDGDVHLGQEEKDDARTALLGDFGWQIIRFANDRVLNDLPAVLSAIESAAHARPVARGWNTVNAPHRHKKPLP